MKNVQFTDLPFEAGYQNILLFQPKTTVGAGENFQRGDREWLAAAFNSAISLSGLIHVSSVCCTGQNDELGGPYALGPKCGGNLALKPISSVNWLREKGAPENQVVLTCSNPQCGMEVISPACTTKKDLSNFILHLMLKQMAPLDLPGLNYLDCGKKPDSLFSVDEIKAIQNLGLISFASEALWGMVANGYFSDSAVGWFGFGFMLEPGMQTACGCGGYDEWLKFLIGKKLENLKEVHKSLLPLLIGPKLPQK